MKHAILASALVLAASPALAEDVTYEAAGASLTGYYAAAENPKGLVLIVHDWDGLDDYERGRADMLAEMGYDAFALDMFGEGTPVETTEDRRAATGALYEDRERMRSLIEAGLSAAREHSGAERVVVMGYCFGGAVALEAARSGVAENAAGYATFHGGLETPEGQSWPQDVAPILVMHGAADTSVTMDHVTALTGELEEAGATYTIEIYSGAPHAFTVEGSDRYQERADSESWQAFSEFLAGKLDG
ncbi:dienelactone hydrolase family protein [Lutibaculum baratangense]|uniref:Dienelactone hydrolase family protein n=1 Tax=Lutibaculum baratangense AMV1 TaxID=631454 RepID=V4RH62_9HYPH|nr:dienelactone hydrolase family protein [Lutibaculum baratangense]ESR22625.1 dienelactone hydrolase family protein [Lutibaculum baratangense AMV1]